MGFGGILPLKTDPVTPVIGDCVEKTLDSIKFKHEIYLLGETTVKDRYKSILTDELSLAAGFFNIGTTEYPILVYDQSGSQFTAQYFKLNSQEKILSLLRLFQLIAHGDVDDTRLLETLHDNRDIIADKLVLATSGAKFEDNDGQFTMNFDLIGALTETDHKNIVGSCIELITGTDILQGDYVTWITHALVPSGSPTKYAITFDLTNATRTNEAENFMSIIDSEKCMNTYELIYAALTDVLAYV